MLNFIGTFFVCLWGADFLTGFAHWLEDTYCLEDYPLIGSFICEPNIEHHVDPQLMVRTGTFFSRNILQWGICAGIFGLFWLAGFGNIYVFLTLLMASFGNEIHRWNHMAKNGPFVTFMKDLGIIQAHRQHSMHHKQPHNQYYCVMTSQVNAVLERISFWRKLEWLVEACTGIAPMREDRRDSKPRTKKAKASATIEGKSGGAAEIGATGIIEPKGSAANPVGRKRMCMGCKLNCRGKSTRPNAAAKSGECKLLELKTIQLAESTCNVTRN